MIVVLDSNDHFLLESGFSGVGFLILGYHFVQKYCSTEFILNAT